MKNNIRIVRNEPNPQVPNPPDFNTILNHSKKQGFKKIAFKSGLAVLFTGIIITVIYLYFNTKHTNKNNQESQFNDTIISAVKPPIKNLDIPYDTFEINVAIGDTIIYKGCTNIIFKPGSIAKTDGTRLQKTKVLYREFQNQTEIMLSGIPMTYDSANQKYLFESGGMFQLKNMNEGEKISGAGMVEVKMCSSLPQNGKNWYSLNEKTGKWDYIKPVNPETQTLHADSLISNEELTENESAAVLYPEDAYSSVSEKSITTVKSLLAPKRKSPEAPTFSIDVNHIPELQVYTNVEFEVLPGQGYDPDKLSNDMDYIKVTSTSTDGVYLIELFDRNKKYAYRARPVFENEKDYQKALAEFRKKEEAQKKEIAKKAEDERKQLEIENRKFQDQIRRTKKEQPNTAAKFSYSDMICTITIDNFGYYNSDRPIMDVKNNVEIIYTLPKESVHDGKLYQYFLNRNAVMVNYSFETRPSMGRVSMTYNSDEAYVLLAFSQKGQNTLISIFTPEEFENEIHEDKTAEIKMTQIKEKFNNSQELHEWIKTRFHSKNP
jgi:hypothetical protein